MSNEIKRERLLVIFDFDHTLVDGNTDTWITKMLPSLKQMMRELQKNGLCWTNIMDKVFCTLHMEGITKENYTKCFESLKFMEGMKEACNFLRSESIPTIIISDSNNWFIHHLLERDSLQEVFSSTYTNPAWWDETGCLHVADHHAHQCNTCPRNLCKRKVLEEHMTCHGQTYKHIVYVGDGNNDLCPCLALKGKDYILAREGYRLLNGLLGARSSEVTAEVIPWVSGFDVLQFFQKLCAD